MRRMPLLLVALVALPAARAVPPDRSTHSRLALLHEIEDDVRELDATLDVSSTNDDALRELERNDAKELFEAAGGRVLKSEKELEDKFNEKLEPCHAAARVGDLTTEDCRNAVTYRHPGSGYTVLMEMVRNYDWPEGANEVLGRGLDVDATTIWSTTALHSCAAWNSFCLAVRSEANMRAASSAGESSRHRRSSGDGGAAVLACLVCFGDVDEPLVRRVSRPMTDGP